MFDETKHSQVHGAAVALSGGAGVAATVSWQEASNYLTAFQNIPARKRLMITDVLIHPQGSVKKKQTVNVAWQMAGGSAIFLQVHVDPGVTAQVHYTTPEVGRSGESVMVFTDASGPANQHFSVTLVGYLAK
jgi:hypothetical protein